MFSVVDNTLTSMGKRMLRQWICMPLLQVQDIMKRQKYIQYFEASQEVVHILKNDLKLMKCDLEKTVSNIHVNGVKLPDSHAENRAVYFDTIITKNKIQKLLDALESFQKLQFLFKEKLPKDGSIFSNEIVEKFPDLSEVLDYFRCV